MPYTLRFFSLQNAVCFIMLTSLVPVLFKFCIQGVLKLKKINNSGTKGLIDSFLLAYSVIQIPVHAFYFNLLKMSQCLFICSILARHPPVGQCLLIHEFSRSHTTTYHIRKDSSGRVISPTHCV